jgi:cellulose synthase (UDP-forming)
MIISLQKSLSGAPKMESLLPAATNINPNKPYLINVLNRSQKRALDLFIGIWFLASVGFLLWWFEPEHFTDILRFSFNSFVILWITVAPMYYFYFLRRMTKPNPNINIPQNWRVAMITTRVPSHEPWEVANKCLLAMIEQEGIQHDTWLADEDPSERTIAWCQQHGVKLSTRKYDPAYHQENWPRRRKTKEGNLRYFYEKYGYDNYDFVIQMDPDHVPQKGYMISMLQPFVNPKVGYVSAPSMNVGNTEHSWMARGRLFIESTLHGTMQAGCNEGWAPMCIGSHYAVRTTVLRDAGGPGPELAEDHSTTMLMAATGCQGVHSIDAVAYGDGPANFGDGVVQEVQWSRSLAMVLIDHTPRYLKRLSPRRRFQFIFSQLWYYLYSFAMFCGFILAPLGLATGVAFANVNFWEYLIRLALPVGIAISILYWLKSLKLLRPQHAKIISWEVMMFQLARWPWVLFSVIDAIRCSILRTKQVWKITPKRHSATKLHLRFFLPYVLLLSGCILAMRNHKEHSPDTFYYLSILNCLNYVALLSILFGEHAYKTLQTKNQNKSAIQNQTLCVKTNY